MRESRLVFVTRTEKMKVSISLKNVFLLSFVVWVLEYCMTATITILRVQAAEMKHNFSLLFFFYDCKRYRSLELEVEFQDLADCCYAEKRKSFIALEEEGRAAE